MKQLHTVIEIAGETVFDSLFIEVERKSSLRLDFTNPHQTETFSYKNIPFKKLFLEKMSEINDCKHLKVTIIEYNLISQSHERTVCRIEHVGRRVRAKDSCNFADECSGKQACVYDMFVSYMLRFV